MGAVRVAMCFAASDEVGGSLAMYSGPTARFVCLLLISLSISLSPLPLL